jgi:hypothetical protein
MLINQLLLRSREPEGPQPQALPQGVADDRPRHEEVGEHQGALDGSAGTAFVKVTPKVISVLDYSKGFGHTDLVRP